MEYLEKDVNDVFPGLAVLLLKNVVTAVWQICLFQTIKHMS